MNAPFSARSAVQPFLFGESWIEVLDGNDTARALFERHYSCNPLRRADAKLIVGPGQRLVLLTPDARALCVWRREDFRFDGQEGVNCAVFRHEGGHVASTILRTAMVRAWQRWPGERLFTFVDPREVTPTPRAGRPTWGHCFYQAGWRFAGLTKKRLHVLEHVGGEA